MKADLVLEKKKVILPDAKVTATASAVLPTPTQVFCNVSSFYQLRLAQPLAKRRSAMLSAIRSTPFRFKQLAEA